MHLTIKSLLIIVIVLGFLVLMALYVNRPDDNFSLGKKGPVEENLSPPQATGTNIISEKILNKLAEELTVQDNDIKIVSVADKEWPDACLGMAKGDELCATVITPGLEIIFDVQEERYFYRTNMDGTVLRFEKKEVRATPREL